MNESQRRELHEIRTEQRLLTARLAGLERRLADLEVADRNEAVIPTLAVVPMGPSPVPTAPAPVPALPLTGLVSSLPLPAGNPPVVATPAIPAEAPAELPPPLPVAAMPPPMPPPAPAVALVTESAPERPAPVPPALPSMSVPASVVPGKQESLEMRIGTTWFVRVGSVLFVTSLAFLGSYLYKNIVPHLGPAAKVGLLYAAAGAVTGVGAWLERSRQGRESERMRNFAGIVLAGGLAAVYYVTYAAHYYQQLRVVSSQIVAGGMLLAWAAFMVWLAERRASESLATVAILLAYYTSAINEGAPGFTLVSNLFLTAGAVFLLRRHLWRVFPFASVLATFGSYAFWNYFHSYLGWRGVDAPPHHDGTNFWLESASLLTYWLLFTWAAFTAPPEALPPVRRSGFVTLNNGAFFTLETWLVAGEAPHDFWKWSLGFGLVLIALSEASRRMVRRLDAKTEGAYLFQGVLLVVLGTISYFSGWQLSLVLAVQTVALLVAAGQRRDRLLLGAAYGVGLCSFWVMAIRQDMPGKPGSWITELAEGAFLVLAAWWSQRLLENERAKTVEPAKNGFRDLLVPAPAYFSFFGLLVWLTLLERHLSVEAWHSPALALAAIVLAASVYVLRIPALPIYAQGYLLIAGWHWILRYGGKSTVFAAPWWNPVILLAAVIALGHWWRRKETRQLVGNAPWEWIFALPNALAAVLLVHCWLEPPGGMTDRWIGELALLALGFLAYGLATGYRTLAAAGQWFLFFGAAAFLSRWHPASPGYHPEMWLTLGPWAGGLLTMVAFRHFVPADDRARLDPHDWLRAAYEVATLFLFSFWAGESIHRQFLFALFCALGLGIFALGVWRRERRWLMLSGVPTALGLVVFWQASLTGERHGYIDLLGVVCLGAQQWWGQRQLKGEGEFPRAAQYTLITAATLCAWAMVTDWMAPWRGGAFTLVAAWSFFAAVVFATGLTLRERLYRWLGLGVLAVTLARVAIVDIWQLDSLGRAVSVFCLSITLLGLGYLYNRFHDKWQSYL